MMKIVRESIVLVTIFLTLTACSGMQARNTAANIFSGMGNGLQNASRQPAPRPQYCQTTYSYGYANTYCY